MRRMSPSACRAVSSIERSSSASSGRSWRRRRRSEPLWTAITLTAWATTSCSSRAIRARSSATASRARTSRSTSNRSARSERSRRTTASAHADLRIPPTNTRFDEAQAGAAERRVRRYERRRCG